MDITISRENIYEMINQIKEKFNIEYLFTGEIASGQDLDNGTVELRNIQILCKSINNALQNKDIDQIIEPEDLINPERYAAKEQVEIYIDELEKHKKEEGYIIDTDDIDDIEFLLNEYDLMDKKIKVYEVIGDIYFNGKNYEKEYEYMLKAWELRTRYPHRKQNYRVMIKLANNYIYREKYEEAIEVYQKALLNIEDIPEKYLGNLYYNYALANARLKRYTIALEIIYDILKCTERKDYELWRRAYVLEGVCYFEMKDYESALSSYNNALQVLTFTGNSKPKYVIYGNIAEVYTKLKDGSSAHKYLNGILDDFDKLDQSSNMHAVICNQLAVTYGNLNELEKATKYYIESLKAAKSNSQKSYIIRNITALINLNSKIEIENIFDILEEYIDDISPNIRENENLLVFLQYLQMHMKNKEYTSLGKLIDSIIKNQGG